MVLGLLTNGLGLLAVGGVGFAFFFFFLFLVMVGLMSVGVVGFVIDDGGGFNLWWFVRGGGDGSRWLQ